MTGGHHPPVSEDESGGYGVQVALPRAINVSGKRMVPTARLRELTSADCFPDVRT